MRKTLTLIALMLACATLAARPVSLKDAQRVAKNFVMQYDRRAIDIEPQLAYVHLMPKSNEPAMYVLNVGNAFVIVAANDVAHPVLGYSLGRPWPTASGEKNNSQTSILTPPNR